MMLSLLYLRYKDIGSVLITCGGKGSIRVPESLNKRYSTNPQRSRITDPQQKGVGVALILS